MKNTEGFDSIYDFPLIWGLSLPEIVAFGGDFWQIVVVPVRVIRLV
ncbi:hypothetical protein RFN29_32530 [Mesorhizobium sp. VK22B]|uniref:Uncharacterized protein n=1 Tax=Mesorhizobium captivum TaxID=3072319 RepID=A0ABU4ZAK3_9HYPH|nr:hypothetical protein [Mesorhizobium sp. VK22B]MDX8496256.1 hypothetical protein [Mesorhizobium sp. VK22B]